MIETKCMETCKMHEHTMVYECELSENDGVNEYNLIAS